MTFDVPTVLWLIMFAVAFYFMYVNLVHETM